MNKEIYYNSTLGINEEDIKNNKDIHELIDWKFTIKKDVININEKYDQNSNPLLLRENQSEKDAGIAAHKALYAMKRQEHLVDLIEARVYYLESAVPQIPLS